MCGINGIAFTERSGREVSPEVLTRMRDVQLHRGPDGEGIFIKKNIAGLDYKRKMAIFSEPLDLTGNLEDDFERIYTFYRTVTGKIPANGMQHF
jgi:hypothetical protein